MSTTFEPRFTLTDDPLELLRRMQAEGTLDLDAVEPELRARFLAQAVAPSSSDANGNCSRRAAGSDGHEASVNTRRRRGQAGPSQARPQPHTSPSPNGNNDNAEAPTRAISAPGHDPSGKFAKGNPGGPGNPFGRYAAMLRTAFMKTVTPERMQEFATALMDQAIAGNVAAARVVAQYTIGKPTDAPDPDRLNLAEWDLYREPAHLLGEFLDMVKRPGPETLLQLLRIIRPERAQDMLRSMGYAIGMGSKEFEKIYNKLAAEPPEIAEQKLHAMARAAAKQSAAEADLTTTEAGRSSDPRVVRGSADPAQSANRISPDASPTDEPARSPSPNGDFQTGAGVQPMAEVAVAQPLAAKSPPPAATTPARSRPPGKRRNQALIPKALRKGKNSPPGTTF